MKLKCNGVIYEVEYVFRVLDHSIIKVMYPELLYINNIYSEFFLKGTQVILLELDDDFFHLNNNHNKISYYTNDHPFSILKRKIKELKS